MSIFSKIQGYFDENFSLKRDFGSSANKHQAETEDMLFRQYFSGLQTSLGFDKGISSFTSYFESRLATFYYFYVEELEVLSVFTFYYKPYFFLTNFITQKKHP